MPDFWVVPGATIAGILAESMEHIRRLVTNTYLAHEAGESVNPDSYFLRLPHNPAARVIALPAYLGGSTDRIGIKWISSFPANLQLGLPRASAVLILNDSQTGYPVACLEAAGISAARTAASAAVTLAELLRGRSAGSVGFVGAGYIARSIIEYVATVASFTEAICHDLVASRAVRLAEVAGRQLSVPARPTAELLDALKCDVVIIATTASRPYIPDSVELHGGHP